MGMLRRINQTLGQIAININVMFLRLLSILFYNLDHKNMFKPMSRYEAYSFVKHELHYVKIKDLLEGKHEYAMQ